MTRRSSRRRSRPVQSDFAGRRRLLLGAWLLAGSAILLRAGQVQIVQASEWRTAAEGQHADFQTVPAARGTIYDRNGVALVLSRERFEIAVAVNEVLDDQKDELLEILGEDLGATRDMLRRIATPRKEKDWVVIGTRFSVTDREKVRRLRGVHIERIVTRERPYGQLALGVLGAEVDGEWRGGIEQAFDDILAGRPGRERIAKDSNRRPIPGQTVVVSEPKPGGDVTLTLDVDLQEIAEKELARAIAEHEAEGGDLLVLAPYTGEILALASIQDGHTNALSAINTSYEPGSTIKPFTVAGVLRHGVAALEDSVDTGAGYAMMRGRPVNDTHRVGVVTLAEALRESSNIGVATAALRLSDQQLFENLRDFGFGTRTAIELPGETPGHLDPTSEWEFASPVALSIGYEISVTPLQMALAYGALANGGSLMEPRIIRETRSPQGELERRTPRVVRGAVDRSITEEIGEVLVDVVEGGTGTRAQIDHYQVAGKSGTARMNEGGRYVAGKYFGSFVGYFPADDPQIVVYAKLDAPRSGGYYGGAVAAPMLRATMEAALASRQSPLSRARLLRSTQVAVEAASEGLVDSRFATTTVALPADTTVTPGDLRVPDVAGLSPRAAIRRLHQAGFRVVSHAPGAIEGTRPAAGTRLQPGDTVRLVVEGGAP